ncbi:MAG: ethanolamine utilization microcompartment protein EutL [Ruminococcaceae bacterium]|nr:ethanolamine utilization microcompartment protein EutL [Oscillospiraceae bacterium]
MKGDRIHTKLLSVQEIPNADKALLEQLNVPAGFRSLGILTTDCDDVGYVALDEATKKADVCVVYARSMYAGASNASTKLAGEFIGILAGPTPAEVRSGIDAFISYIENDAFFYSANSDDSIVYFSHVIAQTGTYLSAQAGVPKGTPMLYVIAPPNEAICGIDEALKSAEVEMNVFYGPPSETNFAGGLLTGTQAACRAASEAFARRVNNIADRPISID